MRRIDLIGLFGTVLLFCGLAFFDSAVRGSEMFFQWMLGPLLRLVGGVLVLGWAMYRILNPRRAPVEIKSSRPGTSSSDDSHSSGKRAA